MKCVLRDLANCTHEFSEPKFFRAAVILSRFFHCKIIFLTEFITRSSTVHEVADTTSSASLGSQY